MLIYVNVNVNFTLYQIFTISISAWTYKQGQLTTFWFFKKSFLIQQ